MHYYTQMKNTLYIPGSASEEFLSGKLIYHHVRSDEQNHHENDGKTTKE